MKNQRIDTNAARTPSSTQGSDKVEPSSKAQQLVLPLRTSQRQACKGTFKRILQQQRQEDQAFAEFEAAVKLGKVAAAPVPAPAAPAPEESVVVKKRRGRPPKPRPLIPVSTRPLLHGPHLVSVLHEVHSSRSRSWPLGSAVWVKVMGYCAWPGLVWSLDLCTRATWPDIVTSYEPGKLLVRFYGEHSSSWVSTKQLLLWEAGNEADKVEALKAWGKKTNRSKLVAATLGEIDGRADSKEEEVGRMTRMGKTYQLDHLQLAARARHTALLHPVGGTSITTEQSFDPARAAAATEEPDVTGNDVVQGTCSNSCDGAGSGTKACVPLGAAAIHATEVVFGNPWGVCDVCREEVPNMRCSSCRRWLHALCCSPAALSPAEFPADKDWNCPACGAANEVKVLCEEEYLQQAAGAAAVERMGLTPDWIISTAAFKVFQLPRPTAECPYIAGLLDPACNNKLDPNIPAEVLYDKHDDGLKPSNSWAGFHIILNPDFRAQVQWKFVNRAIDEVENDNVPAVLLICRNSTDTAYFQRLRPYPRVLLRRSSAQFKDYDKSPIGFGVVVFCVAKSNCHELYERFFEGFAVFGEPNIPIDKTFLSSVPFLQLLDRLRLHAEQYARDHWVQCSSCRVWRIITYQQLHALQGDATAWTCSRLRPPHTSCATPQSKAELTGVHHAAIIAAASGNITAAKQPEGAESQVLAAALKEHQDQLPKSSKRFAALQQALTQQAALATATAAGSKGREEHAAAAAHTALADDAGAKVDTASLCVGLGNPAVAAPAGAPGDAVANAGPGAAELLLLLLGTAADSLRQDLGVSYLCKSTAGQISNKEARQLLELVTEKQQSAAGGQSQQREPKQTAGHAPAAAGAAALADELLHMKSSFVQSADDPAAAEPDVHPGPYSAPADHKADGTGGDQQYTHQQVPLVKQQQQQCTAAARRPRQSSRLLSKRAITTQDMEQQQQQQQHKVKGSGGETDPSPSPVSGFKRPGHGRDAAAGAPGKRACVTAAPDGNTHSDQGSTEAPAAAAVVLSEPLHLANKATQTAPPAAHQSPGLQHLATVVQQLLTDWLLLLVTEQLVAWDQRLRLIQQALLREELQEGQQQQQHLGAADQQQQQQWCVEDEDQQQQQQQQQQQCVEDEVLLDASTDSGVDDQEELVGQPVTCAAGSAGQDPGQQPAADTGSRHVSAGGTAIEAEAPDSSPGQSVASLEEQHQQHQEHRQHRQLQPQPQECNSISRATSQGLQNPPEASYGLAAAAATRSSAVSEQSQRCNHQLSVSSAATTDSAAAAVVAAVPAADDLAGRVAASYHHGETDDEWQQNKQQHTRIADMHAQETMIGNDCAAVPTVAAQAGHSLLEAPTAAEASAALSDMLKHTEQSVCGACQQLEIGVTATEGEEHFHRQHNVIGLAPAAAQASQLAQAQAAPTAPPAPSGVVHAKSDADVNSTGGAAEGVTVIAAAVPTTADIGEPPAHAAGAWSDSDDSDGSAAAATAAVDSQPVPCSGASGPAAVEALLSPSAAAESPVSVVTSSFLPSHHHHDHHHHHSQLKPQVQLAPDMLQMTPQALANYQPLVMQQNQLLQQSCLRRALLQPAASLTQQQQQCILVRVAAPSTGAAPASGVLQVQLLPLTGSIVQPADPQQLLQQQQQLQLRLQWQLAQAAMLQQLRHQQLLGQLGRTAMVVSPATNTSNPGTSAAATQAWNSCRKRKFDEGPKRAAAKRAGADAAASAETLGSRALNDVGASGKCTQWVLHEEEPPEMLGCDAAYLAAQPRLEAADAAGPCKTADQEVQPLITAGTTQGPGPKPSSVSHGESVDTTSLTMVGAPAPATGDGQQQATGSAASAPAAPPGPTCAHQPVEDGDVANHPAAGESTVLAAHTTDDDSRDAAGAADSAAEHATEAAPGKSAPPDPPSVKSSTLLQVAPVCLPQGTILSRTNDPLLRAVLLEQPGMMRAVVGLLQQVCLFKQKQNQQRCSTQQRQQPAAPGATDQLCAGPDRPAVADGLTAAAASAASDQQHVEALDTDGLTFDLHCPGSDLICWDTLERLTRQPSRNSWGRKRHQTHHPGQQQHGGDDSGDEGRDAVAGSGAAGGGAAGADDFEDEAADFMSSLALAREARVAANRAYLRGLGLCPSAMQSGLVAPLEPDHVAMVTAARQIAKQAAVRKADHQLSHWQRVLDVRRRARRSHAARLRAALKALEVDEAQAQQLVRVAQQTLVDINQFVG